jgi:predicted nicotinamide N-methyase
MTADPRYYKVIDEYANSMFRFEHLHDAWIEKCAAYVRDLFSDDLRGKVVLDYAFGRGNWSLAFLRAGAKQVIAVDASESNVRRFRDYCAAHGIDGIDVRHGNFLESRQDITADILWVYGILQNFEDPDRFVSAVRDAAASPESRFLFYAYDRDSLRHRIVDACRKVATYEEEAAFDRDSLVLTPKARMRARDDLTADHLTWWSAAAMQELLRRHGIFVESQPSGFEEFLGRPASEEFRPHHLLCSLSSDREIAAAEPHRKYAADARLLGEWIQVLWSDLSDPDERRRAALGIMNTHFSALPEGAEAAIVDVFLYVFNLLVRRGAETTSWPAQLRALHALGHAALRNEPRQAGDDLASVDSALVRHLLANNIRI